MSQTEIGKFLECYPLIDKYRLLVFFNAVLMQYAV